MGNVNGGRAEGPVFEIKKNLDMPIQHYLLFQVRPYSQLSTVPSFYGGGHQNRCGVSRLIGHKKSKL